MNTPSALRRAMLARRAPAITFCLIVLPLVAGLPAHAQPTGTPASNADRLAWGLFAAINRREGRAELPDSAELQGSAELQRSARLGDTAPLAWETWANTVAIYREDGADPGPWQSTPGLGAASSSGVADEARFEDGANSGAELAALTNVRHIVAGRMVSGIPPVLDPERLVESRMNRTAFNYVRRHGFYNLDGQMRVVAAGRAVRFPRGSIEVKASWRPIEASDAPRYRTLWVRLRGGERRLYGLTALNVAAKILPTGAHHAGYGSPWLWASFEHVDNAHRSRGEGWQLPSRDAYACPGAPIDCDRAPTDIGLRAMVWRNYRLRGTLTNYVDEQGRPQRLGNSELETGIQSTSSCMTCHARSALAVASGRPSRLAVFATNERRGSIGMPESAWYHADGLVYRPLDFVWSLSQARPRRTAATINPPPPQSRAENFGDSR